MISISGNLYAISPSEKTDPATGEVTKVYSAEVLHKVRGKTEIVSLKLDPLVVPAWQKCIGRNFHQEVIPYAIKTREGGVLKGYSFADKKALPNLIAEAPVRAVA